jgi:hypothetical protein
LFQSQVETKVSIRNIKGKFLGVGKKSKLQSIWSILQHLQIMAMLNKIKLGPSLFGFILISE